MASLSEMPVDVLHHFSECYIQFCAIKNTHALLAVKKYLPKKMIDFVCDTLTVKEWSILLRCLKYDKSLNCISIKSRKMATTEVLMKVDTKEKAAAVEKQRHPLLYTKYIKVYLMKSLKMCLTNHPELKCLKLEGLPLEDEDIQIVTNGLNACMSLLHLSFNKSHIGDKAITQVCHILKHKPSISSVDFGDCSVGEQGVDAIARMIVYQNLWRHDEGWKQSLRDRIPAMDELPGLRRITLNQNKTLGDKGVEMLINALLDDRYIKALDLQECGVTSNIAEKLISLLEKNTSIKIIDVRCNPQLNDEHLNSIMETLSRNNDGEIHEFTWLELPYSMRPVRVYSRERDTNSMSTTSVRTIGIRRELTMATISSNNRKPFLQRTYSFSGDPKHMLASPSRKTHTPLLQTQFEQLSPFAAPPPSPMKPEALPDDDEQQTSATNVGESDGDTTMRFQKCDVSHTNSQDSDHSGKHADDWRYQSDEGSLKAVMRKAQSYHGKSNSILPDKFLMKNVSKSESVIKESPLRQGALEKNVGDHANPRYRLDMQLARLEKRSDSTISDYTLKNNRRAERGDHKNQTPPIIRTPTQRIPRKHISPKEGVNLKCTGSSNRNLPPIKSSKTTATVFCEATLNKMTMDEYNKYVFERNKNSVSNYVPKPGIPYKEHVKKCAKSRNLNRQQMSPFSGMYANRDSAQTDKTNPQEIGSSTQTTTNESQTLVFSSDEEEASNTNY